MGSMTFPLTFSFEVIIVGPVLWLISFMCIVVGTLLPSRETFDMIGYPWLFKAIKTKFGGDQI